MSLSLLVVVVAALLAAGVAAAAAPERCVEKPRKPAWLEGRRATVLVDSVLLGGVRALRGNLAGWRVDVRGRPAVTIGTLAKELRERGARVARLVVIGVGYNSLWERGRRRYASRARLFDAHAIALLQTLKRLGAEQFVWVTLREARRAVIPRGALWQHDRYAWYFPYVNERLGRLDSLRGDLALADWAGVSDRRGITYDAIHLDPDGAELMARTIRRALEREGHRQTIRSARPPGCSVR